MLHIYNVVYSASLIHNTMPNYVSCVLFEIVGIIWCLSLCLLMPAVSDSAGFAEISDDTLR